MHKFIRIITVVLLALGAACLASCPGATDWYPSGAVAVAGSYEYDDAGVRYLAATVTVENTGSSTISLSTFTVTAKTASRTYWKTVTSDTRVLPGASIMVGAALAYADALETLVEGGLTVGDAFFE
ncbi:MAG TPA: hypothetical protein PK179_12670 [Spirochaetales bacterium]|nr:hypothetical protein [Spirochaetales bacterium]